MTTNKIALVTGCAGFVGGNFVCAWLGSAEAAVVKLGKKEQIIIQAPDYAEDEIELGDLLATVAQVKWLVLSITVCVLFLGAAYTFVATPIYEADGLLQVEKRKAGFGNLDINELFEGDTSINAEIELLRSRSVLGDVVDNLKLDIVTKPDYFPIIGAALARRGDAEDRVSIQVYTLDVPPDLMGE